MRSGQLGTCHGRMCVHSSVNRVPRYSNSGRPDQANTGLTEPDWSGNFYRTEPDLTEPDLIAYFSNIPSFKVSETLNYEN